MPVEENEYRKNFKERVSFMAHLNIVENSDGVRITHDNTVVVLSAPRKQDDFPKSNTGIFMRLWRKPSFRVLIILAGVLLIASIALSIWKYATCGEVPPFISITADLVNIALIGSVVSVGGLSIFSLGSEITTIQNEIDLKEKPLSCPFEALHNRKHLMNFVDLSSDYRLYMPGDPRFCRRCPLGIEGNGQKQYDLFHACSAYPELHEKWEKLRLAVTHED
jgi:hypothetical protein